jgi:hypothetical protein
MAMDGGLQVGAPGAGVPAVQFGAGGDSTITREGAFRGAAIAAGAELARFDAYRSERALYATVCALIAAAIVLVHVLVNQQNFSDAEAYLYYIDELKFFPDSGWWHFEPFAKSALLVLRDTTGNTETTVAIAHWLIGGVFLAGAVAAFPPRQANWRGLLATFALFGPQLAFVTIRATPAYMIANVAVLQAVRGQYRAFFFAGLAMMFHISAVLALVPILLLFGQSRFPQLRWLEKPRNLFWALGLLSVIFVLLGSRVFELTRALFDSIPFLNKYLIFTMGSTDAGGAAGTAGYAIGHFILLVCISAFVLAYLLLGNAVTRRTGGFVVVSYLIYVLSFFGFSPIAAFRQTPFWAIPAFSLFPWRTIAWRGGGNVPFLLGVAGVFAFQLSRVIVP